MLTVINYLSHAEDLLRLLITSRIKPTGGWFLCTNRESISVWGLVYVCACWHVNVCVCPWMCVSVIVWDTIRCLNVTLRTPRRRGVHIMLLADALLALKSVFLKFVVLLVSPQHRGDDATGVCVAYRQHGLPEFFAHCTGTIAAHERWETGWKSKQTIFPNKI